MDTQADTSIQKQASAHTSGGGSQDRGNEVVPKRARRSFTAAYKLRILVEYAACPRNERGLLLRREGLYSSHIECWRRQRQQGELAALTPSKRGRKPGTANPLRPEVLRLEGQVAQLEKRLRQAEAIIDVQKKLSALLGLPTAEATP